MPSTYTKPNPRTHKRRDYDRQILSDADYAALQGYQSDYQNATTDAQRQQAHQAAEDLLETATATPWAPTARPSPSPAAPASARRRTCTCCSWSRAPSGPRTTTPPITSC